MPDLVNVTMYRAKDGTLHTTPGAAERHDEYVAKRDQLLAILSVIELDAFSLLQYRVNDWNDLEDYGQRAFVEAIAELIRDHFADLSKVMK